MTSCEQSKTNTENISKTWQPQKVATPNSGRYKSKLAMFKIATFKIAMFKIATPILLFYWPVRLV